MRVSQRHPSDPTGPLWRRFLGKAGVGAVPVWLVMAVPGSYGQPLPPPPSRIAPAQITLFLELVVNERASGQVVPVVVRDGHYFIAAAVLQSLYVRTEAGSGTLVAVDQIAGVAVQYDSTGQRLQLTVPTDWLPSQELGGGTAASSFSALSSTGMLLNYDLYTSNPERNSAQASLLTEQRVFGGWGSLSNTGVYRSGAQATDKGYMRYDTRWTYSDTERVRTLTAGDLIAAPLSWGSAVRMGGLQVARNFAIRPDLVTYPLPQFLGQAAVPSAVDLFINGYKASSETVQPGPFTLNTIPYINGAGEASVVTTDALGRQVVTTVPFYVANTLLKKDTNDYSLAVGTLRRDYGVHNFAYGPAAASGAYRVGLSDTFTLESRAEMASSLAVLGVGGVKALGTWGVVNTAWSQSQVRGQSGQQVNLGYQYNGRSFGVGAQHTARSPGYADLTNYDAANLRLNRRSTQVSSSLSLGQAGALSAGYFSIEDAVRQRTRLLSLSYSRPLPGNAFLALNLNKAVGQRALSLQVQLTFSLDARSMVGLTAVRDRSSTNSQVNYSRSTPADGGLGWNLAYAGNGNGSSYRQASATWRTSKTQLQAGVYVQGPVSSSWMGATGSVVAMDGGVFAANRINDAFVLVSTNGVAGVPIRYENQSIGRTDAAGHILVPGVPGFYPARVEVDVLELPDHMQLAQSQQRLSVRSGSGALLKFNIEKTLAARITLVDEQGRPLPVGWQVEHVQTGQKSVVGWDGLVYFEGLKALNELLVRGPGTTRCRVHFPVLVDAPQVLRIGPLACRSESGEQTAWATFARRVGVPTQAVYRHE
jgi:outer membrane usher protein